MILRIIEDGARQRDGVALQGTEKRAPGGMQCQGRVRRAEIQSAILCGHWGSVGARQEGGGDCTWNPAAAEALSQIVQVVQTVRNGQIERNGMQHGGAGQLEGVSEDCRGGLPGGALYRCLDFGAGCLPYPQ